PGPAASPPPTRGSAATVRRKDVRCSGQSQAGTGSSASAGARLRARAEATWSGSASGPGRSTVTSGSATATSASATTVARGHGREQAGRVWSDAEVTGGEDIDIRLDIAPLGSRPGKLGEGRVGKRRLREREAPHYACAEAGGGPAPACALRRVRPRAAGGATSRAAARSQVLLSQPARRKAVSVSGAAM